MTTIAFARHQFPPDIIRHAVWLYLRFTLSFRDVEDLLAERGLDVSYKTVRRWVLKFGPLFARELRRRSPRPTSQWHLDEMAVLIGGKHFWLWRAVDDEGEVLDLLVQRRRDARTAAKLMRKLLKNQGFAPETLVTDRLRSCGAGRRNSAYQHDMSKACARTTEPRIRIFRFVDASGRCSGSNHPDQRNGSYPFTPSSTTRSTFSAISFPATHFASSEAKRCRIGGQRQRPELEPNLRPPVRPKPSSRDSAAATALRIRLPR